MKQKIYILLIAIFLTVPLAPLVKAEPKNKPTTIPILMYHYIRDYHDVNDQLGINLSVSPKAFAAQLDTIKKLGYKTITFQELANNNLPVKPIILTFDDGYSDFYTDALPLLKERHMKAVSYIIAGAIDTPRYMTIEQLKEIIKNNIEIGGHTWSHPDLRFISDKKLNWEIISSKKYLENLFKKQIISFAYPSGKYNNQTVKKVAQAGYAYAITTRPGLADITKNLTLSRLRMEENTNLTLLLKNKKP